uniref:Bifunctional lysine-specific demethylase and histidyl-hydroxylase n=1 Tax=Corethron hystrix TaxID=216773 RepID=A0A6U5M4H6_9STRA|mmetsp:Transcript_8440/g.18514  ORF Transcript_8440/g.18514 Transcript_8440/m.18514 type:complete len:669 (+) Transcript_8440:83-2089(+)
MKPVPPPTVLLRRGGAAETTSILVIVAVTLLTTAIHPHIVHSFSTQQPVCNYRRRHLNLPFLRSSTRTSSDVTSAIDNAADLERMEALKCSILSSIASDEDIDGPNTSSTAWTECYGDRGGGTLDPSYSYAFHSVFRALRCNAGEALGWRGAPFHLKSEELQQALGGRGLEGCFTYDDLEQALIDDFLDAGRGTDDARKGWKMAAVSNPRDSSFQGARMTSSDVDAALRKGTVIFNAIGAHVPSLALPSLALTDAACLPCATNMYVTHPGRKTSAPPHTDRQDVVVVQSQGMKRWRVFSPPEGKHRPDADPYARGKGNDDLPSHRLKNEGGRLLLSVDVEAGDVLFIPAGFPHTTSTEGCCTDDDVKEVTSIHLTFNVETHVWDLNYLSLRRTALKRARVNDVLELQRSGANEIEAYVGPVNSLPPLLREGLMTNLPLDFLRVDAVGGECAAAVAERLAELSTQVDSNSAQMVPESTWMEAVNVVRTQGKELLEVHRDMYLAAIEEGEVRASERDMTDHIRDGDALPRMTQEQMGRLSLFRVPTFYDKIDQIKKVLSEWCSAGYLIQSGGDNSMDLPEDWATSLPLKVGDEVEAYLGGAYFDATVTSIKGTLYDVMYFDGDVGKELARAEIRLLKPPPKDGGSIINGVDTSKMTKKELKKWKKKQGIK